MSEAALIMKDKTPRVVSGDLLECGGKRSADTALHVPAFQWSCKALSSRCSAGALQKAYPALTSRGFHYWLTSGPLARGSRSFAVAVDG